MRANHHAVLVFVAFLMTALVAPSDAETPKQYLIELTLNSISPDGCENVLSSPRLVTLEGHEVSVHCGETLTPPKHVTLQEPIRTGLSFSAKILNHDGRTYIDATINVSSGQPDPDGVRLTTKSIRVVEAITLGKKITVPFDGPCRYDVLVREWDPQELNGSSTRKTTFQTKSVTVVEKTAP